MTLQIVIPYLAMPWALEDCIESMGKTDVPVLVVDNSTDKDAQRLALPGNVEIEMPRGNAGISAGWNMGLDKGADQTLIVSQWVRFAPMEYPRREGIAWGMDNLAGIIKKHANEYGLTFGDQGYHLICIGRETVKQIGRFDENFLAYGEDDDYHHRMDLAGIRLPDFGDYKKSGVYSIAFGAQKRNGGESIDTCHQSRIKEYYDFKWCSSADKHPGDYKTPFNNPDVGLGYWPEVRG